MKKWIEETDERECTYKLKCPVCNFRYSPKSGPDGTISHADIYKVCPKCGEKLDDPAPGTRW